ncbi:hypothetical protein [Crocinitomix catalasitica]|uniref:hypothetical protein n=1 Tax=Crocinitomix catalasitica TaxID=184607 RepID=UPI000483F0E3|nr:hypothetical protein [Crocinitomix catalasitica]
MKKNILMLFLIFSIGISFAQPREHNKKQFEQMKADKIAFITTELDLTPKEAQVFWPVYNEYDAAVELLRKKRRSYFKELRKSETISDDRKFELMKLLFESEKNESLVRLKYLEEFNKVIGKKKAANVFIAEEQFKRKLLDKIRGEGPPPR